MDAWHGKGVSLAAEPSGTSKNRARRRHVIVVAWHEWVMILEDAKAHGLGPAQFIVLLWRNWRVNRPTLSMIPELPVDPWKRTDRAA